MPLDEPDGPRSRSDAIPNANSPQLLTHLLEMVARGVRSTRGLQEALGVDQRTVRYYTQAGAWLGFLVEGAEPQLSPDGLDYVYAGADRQDRYVKAVGEVAFVKRLLLRTGGRAPTDEQLARHIAKEAPDLAAATVTRRASAVRGLIGPLLEDVPVPEPTAGTEQLALPLAQAPTVQPEPPAAKGGGRAFSPDIYRWVLCYLLDHGELTLGHVRGLLDRADAGDVPIGGYVELALSRGDAVRVGERLVATPGAVRRRDMADTTLAVILSDDGWRDRLQTAREARDARATERALEGRYRAWDRRLFGHELNPETVEADLQRVLRDRRLDAWPRSRPAPFAPDTEDLPFLDAWERSGLVIALPPSLVQLWEGLPGVNRRLRNARHRADAVGTPTVAYRPTAVHGGLLHPGEPLPRAVADTRSLRLRLVAHAPYPALVVALLCQHRAENPTLEVRHHHGVWEVRRHRKRLGALLDVLDGFARHRGWLPSRRPRGGLGDTVLVSLLERLGVAIPVQGRLVLDDGFFRQLRHDDEEQVLMASLGPLGDALAAWTDTLLASDRSEDGR